MYDQWTKSSCRDFHPAQGTVEGSKHRSWLYRPAQGQQQGSSAAPPLEAQDAHSPALGLPLPSWERGWEPLQEAPLLPAPDPLPTKSHMLNVMSTRGMF